MAPAYVPGLQLAREFCAAVVRPLPEAVVTARPSRKPEPSAGHRC
jgi:hypothetical protein